MKKSNMKLNLQLIKDYINNHNLTEKEFCKKCRITEYIFGRIMNGKVDLNLFTFVKIVDVLKCRWAEIVIDGKKQTE